MRNSWVEEFWQLVFVILLGTVLGLLVGHLWPALTAFLLAYTIGNLYKLQRLIHWLNDPAGGEIPVHFGTWGTIYARIARMRSGHHQRERRLNQLLGEFQASAAALPDATVALGEDGEIRWFNKAAKDLLKLRSPEDLGQPLVNLFRAPELTQYLAKGDFTGPLDISAPGETQRKLSIRVTKYGSGERLLLAQDITDRIMAEQVRRDFVGNVSHELRTPLTVISGFIENMQLARDEIPVNWEKPVELVAQQTTRMRSIVDDLLLLTRLESSGIGEPSAHIDMAALIETIAAEGRLLAGPELPIKVEIRSQSCLAGDAGLLRSAFTNLLVNAIQYTPDEGHITLVWDGSVRGCVFSVQDTGEGIPAEHLPRLTERFYRADAGRSRERGGTGLGLAIVKQILQQHEARLEIESKVGRGSRFSCIFPQERCLAHEQ